MCTELLLLLVSSLFSFLKEASFLPVNSVRACDLIWPMKSEHRGHSLTEQTLLELLCISSCSPLWLLGQSGPQNEITVTENMTYNCHEA